jgi:phage gpG-like protein
VNEYRLANFLIGFATPYAAKHLVPGKTGKLQKARRQEMIDRFGYNHHWIAAEDFPLLSIDSVRIKKI